jgi:hypothetical protein
MVVFVPATQRLKGAIIAGVSTSVIAVTTVVLAAVGQGQYLEDFCFTRAPVPLGATSGLGPAWEFPARFRCRWHGTADVLVTDWLPFLWLVGCLSVGILAVAVLWWIVLVRPARSA